MNHYVMTRPDQGMVAVVAAEDPYEARLTVQRTFNRGRASRAWMSEATAVELVAVCTPDLEPVVIDAYTWGV